MVFDARAAKSLQPGGHISIDGCPGLRLVARASRKTWLYRYKALADGRMRQVAFGHWPAMSVQTAAAMWEALRNQRGAGTDPVEQKRAERQALNAELTVHTVYTVRRLVHDYIVGHLERSRKPVGAKAARSALERFLAQEPRLAAKPADSVTRADAFEALDRRKGTPTAALVLRSMLGAAWDYALDAGRLDGNVPNWWRAVLKGKLKSKGKIVGGEHVGKARRALRAEEVGRLINWLPAMHAIGRDVTLLYLWTCARGSEILSMRAEHVREEADGWWWTVPKLETKSARFSAAVDLRVPLIGRALTVVRQRLERTGRSGWLFEGAPGRAYPQKTYSTYIYHLQPYSPKVTDRQGEGLVLPVTHWSPHDLRRTGRTLLAGLGCPNEIGEAILGHMPAEIIATYNVHSYDAERREWLGRLSAHLEALAQAALPARP